jgi:pyruvate formate lyase activating enzyme
MASTVDSVLAVVEKDASFYARSGGGMTLSGGEPLLQRDFTLALLREAKCRHIDTSMETCGFVPWKDLHDACTYLDSVLFDIKILDPEKHFAQTGVPLKPVLENFRKMMQTFPELCVHVRTPVVPDFNDSKDVLLPIAELVRRYPNARHELLPYHRLGTQKYMFLGREYLLGEKTLDADLFRQFNRMYRN